MSVLQVGRIDAGTIGWGLLALVVCLSLRVATSFLVVMGAGFSLLERLFIAIAWLPKATVQVAFISVCLLVSVDVLQVFLIFMIHYFSVLFMWCHCDVEWFSCRLPLGLMRWTM